MTITKYESVEAMLKLLEPFGPFSPIEAFNYSTRRIGDVGTAVGQGLRNQGMGKTLRSSGSASASHGASAGKSSFTPGKVLMYKAPKRVLLQFHEQDWGELDVGIKILQMYVSNHPPHF